MNIPYLGDKFRHVGIQITNWIFVQVHQKGLKLKKKFYW